MPASAEPGPASILIASSISADVALWSNYDIKQSAKASEEKLEMKVEVSENKLEAKIDAMGTTLANLDANVHAGYLVFSSCDERSKRRKDAALRDVGPLCKRSARSLEAVDCLLFFLVRYVGAFFPVLSFVFFSIVFFYF